MADRVIRLLATAPVTLYVARSLGPEEFGRLGVATGIAGISILITQLGLDRILRRDLAEAPDAAARLLGTAVTLTFLAALLSIGAVTLYAQLGVSDPGTQRLILILAWGALPQVFAPAEYWFQSVHHPRVSVVARTGVLVAFALLRIAACIARAPVVVFAWLLLAEWTLGGSLVAVLMARQAEAPKRIGFSISVAARWTKEAWPAFTMLLFGSAFERTDILALQHFAPSTEAGYYTAAQRFSELWWSLSATAATAVVPMLTRLRRDDTTAYRRTLQMYFDASMAVTTLVAVGATLFAGWALPIILGESYRPSVGVLVLLSWAGAGVYSEMARSQYLLLERRLHLEVILNVIHLAATAALCTWAVPHYGAMGAAAVRLAGYTSIAWLAPWFFPATRDVARMQWKSLLFFLRSRELLAEGKHWLGMRRAAGRSRVPYDAVVEPAPAKDSSMSR